MTKHLKFHDKRVVKCPIVLSMERYTYSSQTLLSKIESSPRFSISLETQGDHFFDADILGVAISTALGISYYIPLGHVNSEEGELVSDPWQQLDKDHALELLKPYLEDRLRIKAGHDLKATAHVLANRGIDLQPIKADVHLASYVLNSVTSRHALEDIARHYLDQSPIELESLFDVAYWICG